MFLLGKSVPNIIGTTRVTPTTTQLMVELNFGLL